jgi:hypothetical protein
MINFKQKMEKMGQKFIILAQSVDKNCLLLFVALFSSTVGQNNFKFE